jgi:hypothetical protein
MVSMTFASLGWGTWWITAAFLHFKPHWAPSIGLTDDLMLTFATFGFLTAVLTIRARLAWVAVTMVPMLANLSVILIPFTLNTWRVDASGRIVHDGESGKLEAPLELPGGARHASPFAPDATESQHGQ